MNTINAKVGAIPGQVRQIVLQSPASVADALQAVGLDASQGLVTVNGSPIAGNPAETPIFDGDRVIVSLPTKGN